MEFLNELDVPERPISQEIDVSSVPGLAEALTPGATGAADASPPAESLLVDPAPVTATEDGLADAPAHSLPPLADTGTVPRPPSARPKSPEEQLAERRLRLVVRIHTCRDAFRMLGFLGIDEESRKGVGRLLMGLDQCAGKQASGTADKKLVKDPDAVLADADTSLLDQLESQITPVEDRLLALDDGVSREDFRRRILGGKHARKLLARYGRLLASRRLPAGQRRDRFEWLATHLLTTRDEAGMLTPISKQSALPVLQHLIGGLQTRPDPNELREAVSYLQEARGKLREFTNHEAFFESGFFLDVHGYRVSVRDQLVSPDFLYLSAALNADVENALNLWIAELDKLHKANQLTREGSPRERVMALLREQEEAVDNIFGVKRRKHVEAKPAAAAKAEEAQRRKDGDKRKRREAGRKRRSKKRWLPELGADSQTLGLAALVLVIAVAGGFIAFSTGAVGAPEVEYIEDNQLSAVSPVLARGYFRGTGDDKTLEGAVADGAWDKLTDLEKEQAAEKLLRTLKKRGVRAARLARVYNPTPVVVIRDALVVYVAGVIDRR